MRRHESVCCEHCGGTGRRKVTGVYEKTLRVLRRLCGDTESFVVANRDAAKFLCRPTALNNRLSRLERLGLVVSSRHGRQRRFRPATLAKCKKP